MGRKVFGCKQQLKITYKARVLTGRIVNEFGFFFLFKEETGTFRSRHVRIEKEETRRGGGGGRGKKDEKRGRRSMIFAFGQGPMRAKKSGK